MLVPSTFTGWYRNTMMTSARPMAIKRSRVHTRTSLRSEPELCPSVAGRGAGGSALAASVPHEHDEGEEGFCTVFSASCFSFVLCIGRPRIYSMAVAACARFVLCFGECGNRGGDLLQPLVRFVVKAFSLP